MASQAQRITDALRRKAEGVCRMLALEVDKELRRATPVDTGHARRNWIPSVGEPNATMASDESAHQAGVAQVLAYKLESGSLWVANVVPYIRFLAYGGQYIGFVERAIDIAMQTVQRKGGDVSAMRQELHQGMGSQGAEGMASAYSPFGGDE